MKYVQPIGGAANDPYVDANPAGGVDGSPVAAAAIEHPMRELVALISDAGLAPTDADLTQVAKAVRTLVQKQSPVVSAAGGTADAITGSYIPGITALTNGMTLYVRAGSANATTTPTFTPNSGTIAAKTIVKGNDLELVAGDIAGGGHWIELQYDQTLGKWVLLNPATGVSTAAVASVQGAFKNLQAFATGLNATVTVSADEIAVEDSSNAYKTLRAVSLSINSAGTGANGLDTGSLAASTWYSVWAIYNPTTQTTAGLLSLSATTPTLPSGYTFQARFGWIRTDGTANRFPLRFMQRGRAASWIPAHGTNLTSYPVVASGLSSVLIPASVAAVCPETARAVSGRYDTSVANALIGVGHSDVEYVSFFVNSAMSGSGFGKFQFQLPLESSYIYWIAPSGGGYVAITGWEDNL